jgi:hypothetical protein
MFRAAPPSVFPTAALGNDPRIIAADIPAGGKVSARAIARMYAALVDDVDGTRLLGPARLAQASASGSTGTDEVFGNHGSWALGYAMGLPWEGGETARVIGMAGAGGSWAGVGLDRHLALAVTKNVLSDDFAAVRRVVEVVLSAVDG